MAVHEQGVAEGDWQQETYAASSGNSDSIACLAGAFAGAALKHRSLSLQPVELVLRPLVAPVVER
jgi:hypothetical protein